MARKSPDRMANVPRHLEGAWNRAWFDRMIGAEIERTVADRQPLTLNLPDTNR